MQHAAARAFAFVFVFFVVFVVALPVMAARNSPAPDAPTATIETLSAIKETDGWCVASAVAPFDVMASAPARLTTAEQSVVRFVSLRFIAGATSTRGCHNLGAALATATPCDTLDTDAAGVVVDGSVVTYAVARNMGAGGLPVLSVASNAGTDGAFCVTVGW